MSTAQTAIEWTGRTWNPVRGCSMVSEGCTNCYAMRTAHRFAGAGRPYEGLTRISGGRPVWTGDVRLEGNKLAEPLSWREPQTVFVNSMSDLFHESLSDEEIAAVFGVMAACRHTFQVLTKRAARMREWFATAIRRSRSYAWGEAGWCLTHANKRTSNSCYAEYPPGWPLPNVHLGVSVEDRRAANERIPELIQTPAALRFVSAEPLLEAIDLQPWAADVALGKRSPRLDWVIVGGESGPGARPCDVEWIRDVVQQCRACGTPVFVKQLGAWPHEGWVSPAGWRGLMPLRLRDHGRKVAPFLDLKHPKGGDMAEWPADLRVRERPPKPQGGGSVTFVFHQGDAMAVLPTLTERADCVGGER